MSGGADFWQQHEQELQQQWEEIYGSASTRDAGKSKAVKDSAKGNRDEQKQPDRNEQQPLHSLV